MLAVLKVFGRCCLHDIRTDVMQNLDYGIHGFISVIESNRLIQNFNYLSSSSLGGLVDPRRPLRKLKFLFKEVRTLIWKERWCNVEDTKYNDKAT